MFQRDETILVFVGLGTMKMVVLYALRGDRCCPVGDYYWQYIILPISIIVSIVRHFGH